MPKKMNILSKRQRIIIIIGVPVLMLIIFLLRKQIPGWSVILGKCFFHEITGFHCPGCGNTRSVKALLRGDIILSLRNNPSMPFLLSVGAVFYIENVFSVLGKQVRLVPRKAAFWFTVLALFLIFFIVRNFFDFLAPIPE